MSRSPSLTAIDVRGFRTLGFVVLRGFFDPESLAAELEHVLATGLPRGSATLERGDIRFQYVPMMTTECPASLSLLDLLEGLAEALLGCPVIPTRAKGCRYSGNTPWHVDSGLDLPSLGFAAYLEPLGPDNGALRVIPGSHQPAFSDALLKMGAPGMPALALPSHIILSEPGDLIAFDEHLYHASSGGSTRRQWRADYLGDPNEPAAETLTRAYFEGIYPPDWDGGYDVDRFPSYGPDWVGSQRKGAARLGLLGVYDLAARQEAHTRSRR
jgi:Phytanoyl-CoA dioxygenase (PhyH)